MLPIYASSGGLEAYQRGVSSLDQLFVGENGKKTKYLWKVNAIY